MSWTIYVCPECGDALGYFNRVPYYGRCPKHPDAVAPGWSAGIDGEHVETVEVAPEALCLQLYEALKGAGQMLEAQITPSTREAYARNIVRKALSAFERRRAQHPIGQEG